MKKLSVVLVVVLISVVAFGAGLVDNGNQSASFIRTMNRNASTDIDAVYFNPAGLTKLEDGLYLSFSNQSIFQEKEIKNDYAALNEDTYVGDVKAMFFPDFYFAYKTGKLAVSGAVMPIGGGGSADYAKGLPSFETGIAGMAASLAPYGVTGYQTDISFEGSSIYLAGQFNVSYAISDMISVAVGGRYISANNTYEGYIKDIQVNTAAGFMAPGDYMRYVATTLTGVDSLTAVGTASVLDVATADVEVDAEQTGTAFNGIFGVHYDLDKLQIAIRYAMQAKLEVENDTKVDGSGLFPDGAKSNEDMPAILATGISYQVSPKMKVETDFNYYFNTSADWDGAEDNVDNGYNVGIAVELGLSDKLLASVGYIYDAKGVKEVYQTDMGFTLDNHSIGAGFNYKLNDKMNIDFGVSNTFYIEDERDFTAYKETYNRTTFDVAVGVSYKLF
ncbi:MAG: hypothetical protein PF551_03665 [Candidatus Marinimicrobia bacterium]|nr:hypothetical protein [Candidatus Neomarinimicrobiota bacterium]